MRIGTGSAASKKALPADLRQGVLLVWTKTAPHTMRGSDVRPMVRREGFEPPAFWSVGCHKAKSELFRLRFALFAAIRSTDFSLFPSGHTRSNSILGQKWVSGKADTMRGRRNKIAKQKNRVEIFTLNR